VFFFTRFFVDFVVGNLEGLPGFVGSSRGAENTIAFSGGAGWSSSFDDAEREGEAGCIKVRWWRG
jgi:hypothetical protein